MTTSVARRLWDLVIIAAILPSGCTGHEVTADARSPKAVRLVAVESSPSAESTAYSAVITPNAQVDLVFRVAGYVVDVRRAPGADGRTRALEPGAVVTRGVTLARVWPADYQAVVDKARGARDESNA